ncbi:MAG: CYTH domain-containing protein [Peptococcaceae bacterium]|jgi:inorganic triphosphatase YgiF|nr:CYTH domain-containing protein [Peptococcaceae bacterium]
MTAFKEIELKLKAAGAAWEPEAAYFSAHPQFALTFEQSLDFEASYYDTKDGNLGQKGITFRVRREGERWIATVKNPGTSAHGLHTRNEWSVEVQGSTPDLHCFSEMDIGPSLVESVGAEELRLLFKTRFERLTMLLESKEGNIIELAVDRGEIIAGDRREPIQEIELELKKGKPVAVIALGAELAACYPLLPERKTKFARGLALAGLKKPVKPVKEKTESADASEGKGSQDPGAALSAGFAAVFSALEAYINQTDDEGKLLYLYQKIKNIQGQVAVIETETGEESGYMAEAKAMWRQLEAEITYLLIPGLAANKREQIIQNFSGGQYTSFMLGFWAWIIRWRQEAEAGAAL